MALKVKARERLQKIGKYAGTYRYQLMADLYTALTQEKVIREAALRSGVSQGVMQACWDAAGEVIKAWATEGHSVALPGLGTMRFGLRAKTVADVNDVKTSLISTRRIIFTPATELKNELASWRSLTMATTLVRTKVATLVAMTTEAASAKVTNPTSALKR